MPQFMLSLNLLTHPPLHWIMSGPPSHATHSPPMHSFTEH